MAELVYAADLKSAGLNSLEGSSPSSPTITLVWQSVTLMYNRSYININNLYARNS